MYRAVIFDFFGVIHDDPLKFWLPEVAPDKHSIIADTTRRFDLGEISYRDFLKELANHSSHPVKNIEKKFGLSGLNSDTVQLIGSLKPHVKLGLLSNAGSKELNPLLTKHNLHDLFHSKIISSEVGLAKPDEAIFQHALTQLGTSAEETIFIDDSFRNVAAAKRLGIHGLHFTDTSRVKTKLYTLLEKSEKGEELCAALLAI